MPAEVIEKAFDPFFTTKPVGKGTAIKIYLPRLVGPLLEYALDHAEQDIPLGDHREVVLVVEDEPAVRRFSVEALTELGYQVLEADSANAALQPLDMHPEIVLLFTDVVMPDMNGANFAAGARNSKSCSPQAIREMPLFIMAY